MAGRRPLTTGHVERLVGSNRAKDRLRVFLETLRGTLDVPTACQALELCESHFHYARGKWLQEALELLEPRRMGRPPQPVDVTELTRERDRLLAEVQQLREALQGSEVRQEIVQILATPADSGGEKNDRVGPRPR